jgi:hypothetical protein
MDDWVLTALAAVAGIISAAFGSLAMSRANAAQLSEIKAQKSADRARAYESASDEHVRNARIEAARSKNQQWLLVDTLEQVRLAEQRILTIEERMNRTWMRKSVSGLRVDDV